MLRRIIDFDLEFSELDALEAALPAILSATGPVFVDLKVEPGETYPQDFVYIHSRAARDKFRAVLRNQAATACSTVGASPLTVVLRTSRASLAGYARPRCMVWRLSQMTRSSTCQLCE